MATKVSRITIWFLAGIILAVYGVTIIGSGIYNMVNPPAVVGADLHLDLWWGVVLLVVGLVFVYNQRPSKIERKIQQMEGVE